MKMKTQHTELRDSAKVVLRRKFIPANAYIKKRTIPKSTIYNLKTKKEQTKCKTSGRNLIIKIQAEILKMRIEKLQRKINKTKSCFIENINKIDKLFARLTMEKRDRLK